MRIVLLGLLAAVAMSLAAGCVSTAPDTTVPQIALSPEDWQPEVQSAAQPIGGAIGVAVARNESDSLERLEVLPGVKVTDVVPGGRCAVAGVRVGDVVLTVNGVETNDRDAFDATLRNAEDGSVLALEVRRDTVAFATRLVMRRPDDAGEPKELFRVDPVATRAAYTTRVFGYRGIGARVERLFPKSPLPEAGIGEGDVIVTIDGAAIASAQDLVSRLMARDPGESVTLGIDRGTSSQEVDVSLWTPGRSVRRLSLPLLFDYQATPQSDKTKLSLVDLWIISLFEYDRDGGEREYRILKWIRFGSGYGELTEETP